MERVRAAIEAPACGSDFPDILLPHAPRTGRVPALASHHAGSVHLRRPLVALSAERVRLGAASTVVGYPPLSFGTALMAIRYRRPSDRDAAKLHSGYIVPSDPTTQTDQFVSRAVSALREIVEARLDASDKAVSESTRSSELLHAKRFRMIENRVDANKITFAERCELLEKQSDTDT
jgi:hypothetical protein